MSIQEDSQQNKLSVSTLPVMVVNVDYSLSVLYKQLSFVVCFLLILLIIPSQQANDSLQHQHKSTSHMLYRQQITYLYPQNVHRWYCFNNTNVDYESTFDCCKIKHLVCDDNGPALKAGHCATFDGNQQILSISTCYIYFDHSKYNITTSGVVSVPISLTDLNESVCAPLNRKGLVCSECKEGFGISVTSLGYRCINCTDHSDYWYAIPLFLFLEFVPVTLFYVFILTFQISITSPPMPCFIMIAQFIMHFGEKYRVRLWYGDNGDLSLGFKIIWTFYGVFNLDFFLYLSPPFCLSTAVKPLHIALFDYIAAFYPLFLIFLTWICVKLHDRNVQLIVCLWRPFHKCFVRLRKGWDSKSDLIDVFITFFILSYYKLLYLTTLFLQIESVHNIDPSGVLYTTYQETIDPSISYLSKNLSPFFVFSIITFFTCVFLPPLLLILYPIKCFRSCLSKVHFNSLTVTIFTDKIQSCYRNGLDGGRDIRSFSAFYFFFRMTYHLFSLSFFESIKHSLTFSYGITILMLALVVALMRPYHTTYMNVSDSLLLATISLLYFSEFKKSLTIYVLLASPVIVLMLLFLSRAIIKHKQLLLKYKNNVKSLSNTFRHNYLTAKLQRSSCISQNHYSEAESVANSATASQPLIHVLPSSSEISCNYGTNSH